MVFPVVMYGCESWTVKKAECWRIDAFELWCWRRLLRVPWTARRSNQSILKEISPGCSLEGLMLKLNSSTLAASCEELTCWKRHWCWEGLGAGGEGDDRGWDGWMASPTQWTWVWVNSGSWWWTGRPGVLGFMGLQRVGHNWATELNWTDVDIDIYSFKAYDKSMLEGTQMHLMKEHSFGSRKTSDCLPWLNILKSSLYNVLNATHLLHRVPMRMDCKTYVNPS